jgi:2-oxoisovalerate dehydrogenase E1 component alpha subunit
VPHSSDDDDRSYRSREEVEHWKARDPILLAREYCYEHGLLDDDKHQEFEMRAAQIVDDANEHARSASEAEPGQALQGVWGELPTL